MNSRLCIGSEIEFKNHPRFEGVKIGVLVNGEESDEVNVCILHIDKNTTIPVHTHDRQVDSIYVVSGSGKININGQWHPVSVGDYIFVPAGNDHGIESMDEELRIFVHHSPPLL